MRCLARSHENAEVSVGTGNFTAYMNTQKLISCWKKKYGFLTKLRILRRCQNYMEPGFVRNVQCQAFLIILGV